MSSHRERTVPPARDMSYSLLSKGRSHGSSTRSTSSANGDESASLASPTIGSPLPVFPIENGPGRGASEPPSGQPGSSVSSTGSAGHRGSVVSVVSVQHQHHKSGRSGGGGGGMFSPGVRRHSKGYRDGVGTKLSIVGRLGSTRAAGLISSQILKQI